MENLYGVVGTHEPSYLLASNFMTDAVTISLEPGNGVVPAGAVLYRKASGLYAPAASANIVEANNMVVIRDDVDSGTGTVAQAVAAYRRAHFIAGKVKVKNDTTYEAITAAHEVILRKQGIELSPMDDWSGNVVEFDNVTE